MPLYVYECTECGKRFEFFQHYTDDPITVCPDCQTPTLRKVWQPVTVHYKGNGFYVTDKRGAEQVSG
ncbi:MAG: zinc ribbon domain-containing protein [Clostridiaceae bacterium]|jgi:putative FmdB family regulatory protein|nr:zinc ribbon domain-containing protein [Clostridiaceae bacterium]